MQIICSSKSIWPNKTFNEIRLSCVVRQKSETNDLYCYSKGL